jgi:3-phenylpropionate/trans-cinnamate dioxygenase ferredoxin subunit
VANILSIVEIAKIDEIPVGKMKPFIADGTEILVINYDGNYYASRRRCTHMGGDLSEGKLEGKMVTCPRHGAKFDVMTGRCVSGPKIGFLKLKIKNMTTYEVRVENKSIKVNI